MLLNQLSTFIGSRSIVIVAGLVGALAAVVPTAQAAPTQLWGTYFGGPGYDRAYDVEFDDWGHVVVVGRSNSTSGIVDAATGGQHQNSLGGGDDGFLAQFEPWGELVWSTYYGGTGTERLQRVAIDDNDSIWAAGFASSTGLATPGAFDTVLSGVGDALLVKFDVDGHRQYATYIGGAGTEFGNGVCIHGGTVYVVGSTDSTGLAMGTAFQNTRAGSTDAFIAQLNSSGTPAWITYFGGNTGETQATACAVDENHGVYVVGTTSATNLSTTAGAHDPSHNGGKDGFVAKFGFNGVRHWATYYGGANDDELNAVALDSDKNVYIAGTTKSPTLIATWGAHDLGLTGNTDAFAAKLDSGGGRVWGTFYGGESVELNADVFTDVAVQNDGSVVLSGYTSTSDSTDWIYTADGFDKFYGGRADAMCVVLDATTSARIYGTYNGGGGEDNGHGIAVDFNDGVLVGHTASVDGIALGEFAHDLTYNTGVDVFITFIEFFIM